MEAPNIIFLVVDTLREDYSKPLKEKLEKLGFVSYENVIAPASWTVPSHASIFTGLYPAFHKAHETRYKKGMDIKLKYDDILSISLLERGYDTFLITANPYIRPSLGFTGFKHFYESCGWSLQINLLSHEDMVLLSELKSELGKNTIALYKELLLENPAILIKGGISKLLSPLNSLYTKITAKIKKWPLDKGAQKFIKLLRRLDFDKIPNFIFINLMEVHEPYFLGDKGMEVRKNILTGRLDPSYIGKWKQMYIEEVEYVTQKIMEIMEIIKKKRIFDKSLIIITSDHGQLLGEHGRIGHGVYLYDEVLKVPLLIKYPRESQVEIIKESGKYISLLSLKPFILKFIDGNLDNDAALYSEMVFAESYGIGGTTVNPKTKEEKQNVNMLEKYRIAAYYKNFKGVFNVPDWNFEEVVSYDPSATVSKDSINYLKKEVMKFLKIPAITKISKVTLSGDSSQT